MATKAKIKWVQSRWEEVNVGDAVRLVGSQGEVSGVVAEGSCPRDWDGWVKFVGNLSIFDRVDDWEPFVPAPVL